MFLVTLVKAMIKVLKNKSSFNHKDISTKGKSASPVRTCVCLQVPRYAGVDVLGSTVELKLGVGHGLAEQLTVKVFICWYPAILQQPGKPTWA